MLRFKTICKNDFLKKVIAIMNIPKATMLSIAIVVCFVSIVAGAHNNSSVKRMEKTVKKQESILNKFEEHKRKGKEQCKEVMSIALINTGDNDTDEIVPEEIQNVTLLTFVDKGDKGVVHITPIQRESYCGIKKDKSLKRIKETFDNKNPQKFYDTIRGFVDYNVVGYFSYNNDTIKEIMDIQYLAGITIWENELCLNDRIKQFSDRYGKKSKRIKNIGFQYLDEIQTLAFANIESQFWGKGWNDSCQSRVIFSVLKQLKSGNMTDMDRIGKLLMEGDYDISEKQLVLMGAALRSYRIDNPFRWPKYEKYVTFNNQNYYSPDDLIKCAINLHKKQYKERNYKPSKKLIANAKRLKKIDRFMNEYNRKQAEKKALEREKENTNNSSESDDAIYNSNGNSNNPSNNKTRKSKNNNNNRNNNKTNKSESTEPDPTPTPQPSPEPEPTVEPEPQPQPEENNASDSVEQ